jgi:hypothetical protein
MGLSLWPGFVALEQHAAVVCGENATGLLAAVASEQYPRARRRVPRGSQGTVAETWFFWPKLHPVIRANANSKRAGGSARRHRARFRRH